MFYNPILRHSDALTLSAFLQLLLLWEWFDIGLLCSKLTSGMSKQQLGDVVNSS
jgi:hypothetical protein